MPDSEINSSEKTGEIPPSPGDGVDSFSAEINDDGSKTIGDEPENRHVGVATDGPDGGSSLILPPEKMAKAIDWLSTLQTW